MKKKKQLSGNGQFWQCNHFIIFIYLFRDIALFLLLQKAQTHIVPIKSWNNYQGICSYERVYPVGLFLLSSSRVILKNEKDKT